MTIVKCDKECAYNENGECASDIIWITEIGECDIDEDELNPNKNGVKTELEPCDDWYDVPSDEMTFEQAKQAVKDLREKLAEYLEQEPCDMKQRVEKEYLYESLCEDLKKANAEIKRLSEPFEDAISRQAVDELSKELVHTTRDKADFLCNFWEGLQKLPSVTPKEKIGYCKDCKWWKDNDGVYRRGVGAESKCPINRKEVYEGNGYCFMFEP